MLVPLAGGCAVRPVAVRLHYYTTRYRLAFRTTTTWPRGRGFATANIPSSYLQQRYTDTPQEGQARVPNILPHACPEEEQYMKERLRLYHSVCRLFVRSWCSSSHLPFRTLRLYPTQTRACLWISCSRLSLTGMTLVRTCLRANRRILPPAFLVISFTHSPGRNALWTNNVTT